MKKSILIQVIAALLILLFCYASISKLRDFGTFYGDINGQPFPNWMTPYLAWGLPATELLVVVALISERLRTAGFFLSLIMMSAFTVYIGLILMRVFDRIPCICGGLFRNMRWIPHLYFNLLFTFLSGMGLWLQRKQVRSFSIRQERNSILVKESL